ncbi:MAG: hypothetical protein OZ923_12325 [Comamonadaceae bacterium]|nr:hypothetical protein [Burkholderiales bacterium]MEB2349383.1 hypothetical protein [Comamonadaceae bacterium]
MREKLVATFECSLLQRVSPAHFHQTKGDMSLAVTVVAVQQGADKFASEGLKLGLQREIKRGCIA